MNTIENLTAHEAKLEQAGEAIAKTLDLKKIKSGDQKGKYNTQWGAQTNIGLARTLARILSEHDVL